MMKRVLVVLAVVAMLVTLVGCTSSGGGAGLALGPVPWQDGEKVSYDWVTKSNNQNVGTSDFTFAKSGSNWVLGFTDNLTSLNQTAQVTADGTTLKPLSEEKTLRATATDGTVTNAKLNTTYSGGKLNISVVVNGETKTASVDVPSDALDNDQLLMTLRALKYTNGYQGQVTVMSGQNALKIPTTVRVLNQESVTVPKGTFNCWKLELDFGQGKQNVWYQVDAPNNLVQYDNGGGLMVWAR